MKLCQIISTERISLSVCKDIAFQVVASRSGEVLKIAWQGDEYKTEVVRLVEMIRFV